MLLIPAIDLKNGSCVRLRQGRMDDATVFSDDPVAMAEHWLGEGARRLHIVDLNGAFEGRPANGDVIRRMVAAVGARMPVQVGGGIRSFDVIDVYLDAGAEAVIIGTRAVREPEFLEEAADRYPGRIILGLDARDGWVATEGWDQTSTVSAIEFAERTRHLNLAAIVYTDIERDGMMQGLNVPATLEIARAAATPVIASGGVTNLDDLTALKAAHAAAVDGGAAHDDLLGVITGRAIYEGTLGVNEGQALLDAD